MRWATTASWCGSGVKGGRKRCNKHSNSFKGCEHTYATKITNLLCGSLLVFWCEVGKVIVFSTDEERNSRFVEACTDTNLRVSKSERKGRKGECEGACESATRNITNSSNGHSIPDSQYAHNEMRHVTSTWDVPRACLYHSFMEFSVDVRVRSNINKIATASLQTRGSMFTNSLWPVGGVESEWDAVRMMTHRRWVSVSYLQDPK